LYERASQAEKWVIAHDRESRHDEWGSDQGGEDRYELLEDSRGDDDRPQGLNEQVRRDRYEKDSGKGEPASLEGFEAGRAALQGTG